MMPERSNTVFIECFNNNGKPYLRVAESYCIKIEGAFKNRKRIVRNLGPLDKFDDGEPDFLSRLRDSFRNGAPIIGGLGDLSRPVPEPEKVTVEFDKTDTAAILCAPKNIGYFILDGLYDSLGIYDVLNLHKSRTKIEYDLNGLAKLLVFGRALDPCSKKATYAQRDKFLFDVTESDSLIHLYRALDALDERADTIQKRMNLKISGGVGRSTEVCFYDVTNYWFEIDDNDEDAIDASGNVTEEGMRKRGPSKAKNRKPITQMGLFIDDSGIPIAYRLFPGNHTDQTTLRPALKGSIDKMKFGKVVIIADGGLNNGPNIAHILKEGNGYIVSKSTKKSDKNAKAWMLEDDGYVWNERKTFKAKSKIRQRTIKDENGESVKITEKIVCYWSKKHCDKELHDNAKFIEYLESAIRHPDKLKDRPKKIEKFLAKMQVDKKTGEVLENATTLLSVDMDKVKEYTDLLGYYTIMTSEKEKSDREIIDKYHGLSRIEDSFRIVKSDLEGRPVYVRTPEHINAHFLLCFIALTMIRLIQFKVLKHRGESALNENGWKAGVTAERIKKALNGFMADALPGGYCRLTEPNEDMKLILDSLGVKADLRLPTISELRKLKYSFDEATIM
jgi:transposase